MMLVFIGFTWLQRPSDAEMAEYQRQLDSIEAAQKEQQRQDIASGNVDTLSSTEVAHLNNILENMPADNATINNEGVILSLKDGKLAGTVTVGDTTVTWDEVVADTSANPAVHNLAVQAVQRALDVYAKLFCSVAHGNRADGDP